MKNLIVNADDFGLTEQVNKAIIEGYREGVITSATLLANGSAFDTAVRLARSESYLGVGIHLNLTEGFPLCEPSRLTTLLNEKGGLHLSPFDMVRKLASETIKICQVELELRAQIEKVKSAGIVATHLDAHKHFHYLPPFLEVLIRLAKEYKIPAIRFGQEQAASVLSLVARNWRASPVILKQYLAGMTLSSLSKSLRHKLEKAGLKAPDYILGITSTGFLDFEHLKDILAQLPHGTCELVCHPGYVDAQLKQTPTRLLKQREMEISALTQPGLRDWIRQRNIHLINYRQLTEGA